MTEITSNFQGLFFGALGTKTFWKIWAACRCEFSHDNANILFPKLLKSTYVFFKISRMDFNDTFVDWSTWVDMSIIKMKKNPTHRTRENWREAENTVYIGIFSENEAFHKFYVLKSHETCHSKGFSRGMCFVKNLWKFVR